MFIFYWKTYFWRHIFSKYILLGTLFFIFLDQFGWFYNFFEIRDPKDWFRVSTIPSIPWIPGNILGSEEAYFEKLWINFGTGISWKKFPGCFKYLDSLEKFVVVDVIVAQAGGCSLPEVHRKFMRTTESCDWKCTPAGSNLRCLDGSWMF